jgi:tetratricopeptide (TPR) repeat protein
MPREIPIESTLVSDYMRCPLSQSAVLLGILALCVRAADDQAAFRDALAALQRGDFRAAEQKLRPEVAAHPNNAPALSLLGVTLDNQNQFREAVEFHRRAVAAAPRSADILNNYGNHLAATGEDAAARDTFLKVLALDPANVNANLQLARQSLKRKNGTEALRYLKRLPAAQLAAPKIALLHLEALYLAGETAQADALAASLSTAAQGDAGMTFSLGLALANSGRYGQAEILFTRVLAVAPADFNILFNLGAVAASAGHYERARDVFETASRQQPQNVELLFRLAGVHYELNQPQAALPLLAQAVKLAPRRADIQRLLALTTVGVGALEDALAAWDAYLNLAPDDDFARRDRAFTAVRMGQIENGVGELNRFLSRHPADPLGHFQIGVALGQTDAVQGLAHLDRAVELKPDFAAALSARGALYYQQGKPEAAVADLESAAKLRPDDATNLDRLGQTYLALDRAADAVRVLRRAAEREPGESKIQLHFARALADAGQTAESRVVMDRFRQLGPAGKNGVPAGLVEFLGLSPVQRRADYRSRVEKAVRDHPDDASAQLAWLKLLLEEGNAEQAPALARRIAELRPGAAVLAEAGRALLASKQYALAKEMLEGAAAATPPADVALDLAIATAQVLDAEGQHEEAIAALRKALAGPPPRADLRNDVYWQAAGLLVRNRRIPEALRLFEGAVDPEMLLMKAVLLELAGQSAEANNLLNEVQNRRPEWFAVWVARGAMLAAHDRSSEARQALETAVALGARSPEVRDLLAGKAPAGLSELFLDRPPREW